LISSLCFFLLGFLSSPIIVIRSFFLRFVFSHNLFIHILPIKSSSVISSIPLLFLLMQRMDHNGNVLKNHLMGIGTWAWGDK
jgi:hypothetical protein